MLFSINDLLISPNKIELEITDDPPKLSSGNGIPVKGMIPKTVVRLINIWIDNIKTTPDNRNFS